MAIYNQFEYVDNYSLISRRLCNYYRDEVNDDTNKNDGNNNTVNINEAITNKSFEYQTKLIKTTSNNNNLDAEVVVLLKDLTNFWRSLDLSLINCEIGLDLSWSKKCIITEISITPEIADNLRSNPLVLTVTATQTTAATFQINNVKLYAPVVTLSINNVIKPLENMKQGFKRTISWNKHRSETTQTKSNNLDHLIDPAFANINRLFNSKIIIIICQNILLMINTRH